jgi:predicted transcriptional regulator
MSETVKEEIYKVVSQNVKKNMQCVIMKVGGTCVTRHIPIDPSKRVFVKRRTFEQSAEAKAERDERRGRKARKEEKSTMVEKGRAA